MTSRRGIDQPSTPRPPSSAAARPSAAAEEQFVADAIAALHANGAGSGRSAARADQMASALGKTVHLELGWNHSSVTFDSPEGEPSIRHFDAPPSGVGMNRVLGVDVAINRFSAGNLTLTNAHDAVRAMSGLPPANIFLFAAACAVGASGLAIIFGVEHWQTVLLIAISSAACAFVRRGISALGGSNFWQVGLAALIAGLLGALATNLGISSSLSLAAVCPCMILVPGPHLLNGSFDLAGLRIPLGLSRLTFATLTLLSIGAGLLAGLSIGGAGLSVDPAARVIPLWLDALTAGVVAICYGIFYSAPLRILIWPFAVGVAVHALHWVALEVWHVEAYVSAGLACLVAGAILNPVSRRFQIPFSAIGFASVVSLIPGVVIFRALAGLAQLQTATGDTAGHLLIATVNNANTAWLTIFAMAIGFSIPAAAYSWMFRNRRRLGPRTRS